MVTVPAMLRRYEADSNSVRGKRWDFVPFYHPSSASGSLLFRRLARLYLDTLKPCCEVCWSPCVWLVRAAWSLVSPCLTGEGWLRAVGEGREATSCLHILANEQLVLKGPVGRGAGKTHAVHYVLLFYSRPGVTARSHTIISTRIGTSELCWPAVKNTLHCNFVRYICEQFMNNQVTTHTGKSLDSMGWIKYML